jgi:ABC-2 type transport system ATP-binding protein
MTKLISLTHVGKSYQNGFKKLKVIHDLSLEVSTGEVFGFIGPNGAGKSTVINLLMGFIKPDSGAVTIDKKSPWDALSRANIGYLPEDPRFYENLTAEELLFFAGRSSGMDKSKVKKVIDPLLSKLELTHVKNKQIKTYSKGMKQRMGLGLAMIHDPKLYILDEPMSGLDPIGRNLLKHIVLDLKKNGKTIFFSTHILNDVETLCDRIGIINKGIKVFCGPLNDFSTEEKNFEKAFIDLVLENKKEPTNV